MDRRCQGCGAAEGATKKIKRPGQKAREETVQIATVIWADYGTKLFCQSCVAYAHKLNGEFAAKRYVPRPWSDPSF
jgi:hypothetical protein